MEATVSVSIQTVSELWVFFKKKTQKFFKEKPNRLTWQDTEHLRKGTH